MKVGIIGGGIIGLGIGWQLQRRGVEVTLLEKGRVGRESSWAAAGMLAPYAEVGFEEVELMKLGQESLRQYPRFVDELAEDADNVPEFDRCGTMLVGVDRDDTEHLRRLYQFREELSLTVEMITGTEAREREPLLSPRVVSAIWLPEDAQIDNRALVRSLKKAFEAAGGLLLEKTEVQNVTISDGQIKGVSTASSNFLFDKLVLAAGCWSGRIAGIPSGLTPPIRPVKGQIITLKKTDECDLQEIVRSPRMYLVPKEDGTLRLGASSEEKGFDQVPTAGVQKELLEEGWESVPSIYDLPLLETTVGLRPASRDHAPIIGQTDVEGLYYATGHYRHGILLAPVTVYSLVDEILNNRVADAVELFRPGRFSNGNQQSR